jgi:hypothetical protein
VVETSVRDGDEMLLDRLVAHILRVDVLGCAKLLGPRLLVWVGIHSDNAARFAGGSTLDDGQADTTDTEYCHRVALLDVRSFGGRTKAEAAQRSLAGTAPTVGQRGLTRS